MTRLVIGTSIVSWHSPMEPPDRDGYYLVEVPGSDDKRIAEWWWDNTLQCFQDDDGTEVDCVAWAFLPEGGRKC